MKHTEYAGQCCLSYQSPSNWSGNVGKCTFSMSATAYVSVSVCETILFVFSFSSFVSFKFTIEMRLLNWRNWVSTHSTYVREWNVPNILTRHTNTELSSLYRANVSVRRVPLFFSLSHNSHLKSSSCVRSLWICVVVAHERILENRNESKTFNSHQNYPKLLYVCVLMGRRSEKKTPISHIITFHCELITHTIIDFFSCFVPFVFVEIEFV